MNYYNLSSSKDITFEMVINSGIEIQNDVENCICYSKSDKNCWHYRQTLGPDFSELEKYLYLIKKDNWSWSLLSNNPNITIDIVKKTLNNPNTHWDWKNITENVGKCSLEIALLNPEIPWCWRSINNQNEIKDLENYLSKWCWISLSKNKNIYNAIIKDIAQLYKKYLESLRWLRGGFGFGPDFDEIREHSEIDKRMSDLFQKFLNINREYLLRLVNRIINKDFRLYRNIIKVIVAYF